VTHILPRAALPVPWADAPRTLPAAKGLGRACCARRRGAWAARSVLRTPAFGSGRPSGVGCAGTPQVRAVQPSLGSGMWPTNACSSCPSCPPCRRRIPLAGPVPSIARPPSRAVRRFHDQRACMVVARVHRHRCRPVERAPTNRVVVSDAMAGTWGHERLPPRHPHSPPGSACSTPPMSALTPPGLCAPRVSPHNHHRDRPDCVRRASVSTTGLPAGRPSRASGAPTGAPTANTASVRERDRRRARILDARTGGPPPAGRDPRSLVRLTSTIVEVARSGPRSERTG
jgi:hypothetical protein